jgi:hypothetical protein
MSQDDDLVEFVGRDNKVKADPHGVAPTAPVDLDLSEYEPVPERVAPGTEPVVAAEPDNTYLHFLAPRPPLAEPDDTFLDDDIAAEPVVEPQPVGPGTEPASLYAMHVYDNLGKVRRDLEPSEIAKCTKQQRKILFEMLAALETAEQSEHVAYEARKTTGRATTAVGREQRAYEKVMPKKNFMDIWRTDVAGLAPIPISDEQKKATADALIEVEKAEAFLAACQRAEIAAKTDEKNKRAAFARAAIAWSHVDGCPHDVADLIRARAATERKIAMDNIAAGLPHDYAVAQASTVGPSRYDHMRKNMPRVHPSNPGHHIIRGSQVKLPSER